MFDLEATFNAANEYSEGFDLSSLGAAESDMVLVYMPTYTLDDGTPLWSPLPQTIFLEAGPVIFNFAASNTVLFLLLEATDAVLAGINAENLTDMWFRAVIIPGEFEGGRKASANVDYSNYEEVVKYYNISEQNIPKIRK